MARAPRFDPEQLAAAANDVVSVRRVFGEAYERDGVTVVPVARVWAATGMGLGEGEAGDLTAGLARARGSAAPDDDAAPDGGYGGGHGGGGGYGVRVKAVGVYVIDDRGVHWRPAIDINRIVLGGQSWVPRP